MKVILVPGLWLDASSWVEIATGLRDAGHAPLPLTLPGTGSSEESEIGIAEWVDAVVTAIDAAGEPVVLVGHSGGGNVAWGAAAQRPDQVRRVNLRRHGPAAERDEHLGVSGGRRGDSVPRMVVLR